MMGIITEAFMTLRATGCVSSQRDFSTNALGCRPSYYSSMLARSETRTPSVQVLLTLYTWIRNYLTDSYMDDEMQRSLSGLSERVWLVAMDRVHRKPPEE